MSLVFARNSPYSKNVGNKMLKRRSRRLQSATMEIEEPKLYRFLLWQVFLFSKTMQTFLSTKAYDFSTSSQINEL